MRRFFVEANISDDGSTVLLSNEESRHVSKVLRLVTGDEVELLDGSGAIYRSEIVSTDRRVSLRVVSVTREEPEEKSIWVYQGILKGEKMDTVVQKCTELGVRGFSAYHSSRCQGKLNSQQSRKKQERWQRIGLNACKQCLRAQPMQLDMPRTYSDLHTKPVGQKEMLRLLFWEEEKQTHLYDIPEIATADSIALLLGPEGGLSGAEVELAREQGYRSVSLGKKILRAETATLTAVSVVQYLAGNL